MSTYTITCIASILLKKRFLCFFIFILEYHYFNSSHNKKEVIEARQLYALVDVKHNYLQVLTDLECV
jgi:hypothetical protein